MKRLDRKSDCAINYTLEMVGDQWSMLIIRDIVYYGKRTFGEFLSSDESIATSALSRRLLDLEQKGILHKDKCEDDKRKEVYDLTDKGLGLIPLLLEMAEWGARYDSQTGASLKWINYASAHKKQVAKNLRAAAEQGEVMFAARV
jgi:DNA-binding HxlR family transcriptional regulator